MNVYIFKRLTVEPVFATVIGLSGRLIAAMAARKSFWSKKQGQALRNPTHFACTLEGSKLSARF